MDSYRKGHPYKREVVSHLHSSALPHEFYKAIFVNMQQMARIKLSIYLYRAVKFKAHYTIQAFSGKSYIILGIGEIKLSGSSYAYAMFIVKAGRLNCSVQRLHPSHYWLLTVSL